MRSFDICFRSFPFPRAWTAPDEAHYSAMPTVGIDPAAFTAEVDAIFADMDEASRRDKWAALLSEVHGEVLHLPLWGKRIPAVVTTRSSSRRTQVRLRRREGGLALQRRGHDQRPRRRLEEEEVLEQEGGDALRDALRHRGRHPRVAGLRRLLHGLEGAQGRAALRAEARVEPDARRPREGLSGPLPFPD